jgi:ppGpp synthetase/RelA/SpoT-type nucleotidyltranferase
MVLIEDFIARYRREYDYFLEVSRLCAELCEARLEEAGIRAIVTYRAKRPDRLGPKLQQRLADKNYQSIDEIYADIVDLAGVRIALYFPSDLAEVEKLVTTHLDLVEPPKVFPDKTPPKHDKKRFKGYVATHYRVRLKAASLRGEQVRYADARVELQVASVLMHAWAEVEHDLVYKPLSGSLSEDEYLILDQLNGVVLNGEGSLEQLRRAQQERVGKPAQPFANHYELASYLYESVRKRLTASLHEPVMGRVDRLFRLIQSAGLNRAEEIDKLIATFDTDTEKHSVADQIIDHLLAARGDLYEVNQQLLSKESSLPTGLGQGEQEQAERNKNTVGAFLGQWARLENALREVAIALRPGIPPHMTLTTQGIRALRLFDPEKAVEFERVRAVRDGLIHGKQSWSMDAIGAAAGSIDHLLDTLRCHADEAVRRAVDDALKPRLRSPGTGPETVKYRLGG